MLYVFIDANILLSLYRYAKDDLEKLEILIEGFKEQHVNPITSTLLWDEVARNRPNVLQQLITELQAKDLRVSIPNACRELEASASLRDLSRRAAEAKKVLLDEFVSSAEKLELAADKVIKKFFDSTPGIPLEAPLIEAAEKRRLLRNPPLSKAESIGDAVHWLTLLAQVPKGDDLHMITEDSGFSSPLDKSAIHPFLAAEWSHEKDSDIHLYPSLTDFIRQNFPGVNLPGDMRRNRLIRRLEQSGSFNTTHSAIADLEQVEIKSVVDANRILRAAVSNRQISWISDDDDVRSYLWEIADQFEDSLEDDLYFEFAEMYAGQAGQDDDDNERDI